ncbi:MAG: MATE family efflux transporter [Propionibacteriales bacterium]|nr:MATE family efflux transporter [Propionibacteriales bacterium]
MERADDHTRLTTRSFTGFSLTMFAVGMISVGFGAVDMALVAPFGVEVLAAVGLGEVVVVTASAFLAGPIDVLTSRVAQSEGGERLAHELGSLLVGFVAVLALLQVVAVGFAWSSETLLVALGQDPAAAAGAATYVQVRLGGVALTVLFMVTMELLRILGMKSASVVVLVVGLAANAGLDLLLLHGPPADHVDPVAGVAVATVLVHAGAALVGAALLVRRLRARGSVARPGAAAVRDHARATLVTGSGVGLRHLNDYAAAAVPFLLVGTLGVQVTAAAAVATKIWTLYCRVPQACTSASFVFYGYALGREQVSAELRRRLLVMTAVPTLSSALLVLAATPWLVDLLGGGSVDRGMAALLTAAFLVGTLPYLFEKLAGELLTVEGDAGYLAVTSTLTTYLLTLPLAALSVLALGSAFGAFAAGAVGSAVLAVLFWRRLTHVTGRRQVVEVAR